MEKNYGNLRKPARQRRARAMQRFLHNKEYSTTIVSRFVCEKRSSNGSILSILGLPLPSRPQLDHRPRSMTCVCFAKPSSLGVTEPFLTRKQPF